MAGARDRPTVLAPFVGKNAVVEVALLDLDGVIVHTNVAWDDFCLENGGILTSVGVGVSYLEACAAAGDDPSANAVGEAIRMALRGDLPAPLSILVPCDSPAQARVFNTLISSRLDEFGVCIGATVTLSPEAGDEHLANGHQPALATSSRRAWTPDPLPALLRVCDVVPAESTMAHTLRRLVESARDVLGVSYAAIGVSGPDGVLEEFAHAGIDAQTVKQWGSAPAILDWLSGLPNSLQRDVALRGASSSASMSPKPWQPGSPRMSNGSLRDSPKRPAPPSTMLGCIRWRARVIVGPKRQPSSPNS